MSKSKLGLVFANSRGTKSKVWIHEYKPSDGGSILDSIENHKSPIGLVYDHPGHQPSKEWPHGLAASIVSYPLVTEEVFADLTGKMLTVIDAAIGDPEQRKALKDILRNSLGQWRREHGTAVTQTYESGTYEPAGKPLQRQPVDVVEVER